ncbi:aminoacetone oxidase family FAD-binding enzyme [Fischerella thermalis CCMEE 5198]|jgi:predicted Rossmann fold flavoprotein|uniref:NAD(P)/FAD-dependent oxidoreductase n=1 Tax=Fischerella thermalis TaxID=372787 RepID=UPI000C802765|nr:NAD(P)/FAD-dependent oxidoreductase [Fischerella thermalis]PLZ85969.1 aminoacetone oxidase family FAD-binding enzyme [Fischerella thermalis CCMEE 5196]PMB18094.1 aminoacetone oxidase family FAD-binding enzyme [Fischerella thermalis CCMEE 5198]
MTNDKLQIVVIGGGAAGFFGAIAAAKVNPYAHVILLEASHQPLAKVRISGGGRCNVTHACFEPQELVKNYPRGGKALLGAFTRFQPQDTITWFQAHGVKLKTEADGRMFPTTDSSETIVNCLMSTAKAAGVELRTGTAVAEASLGGANSPLSRFEITLKSGEKLQCDRLLLATGSNPIGYKIAQQLGHTIEPPVPSLFTFNIKNKKLTELAGVSVNPVKLRLILPEYPHLEQTGPLLITHWGLSGPAVLKLSAWGARMLHSSNYQATLVINWLPYLKQEQVRQHLLAAKKDSPKRLIASHRVVDLPHRLWQYIVFCVGISSESRWAELSNKTLNQLVQELTQAQSSINGKGAFKEEFVTCGGVNLKEINFKTMESKLVGGLYFAGEILDIDGVTGGFNFQSAWTTAYLAGLAMASDRN